MRSIISFAILSVHFDQASIDLVVLLKLSDQTVVVLLLELADQILGLTTMIVCLVSGSPCRPCRTKYPALNAWRKPSAMMRSQKMTVSF
jgi:hypothetical protein